MAIILKNRTFRLAASFSAPGENYFFLTFCKIELQDTLFIFGRKRFVAILCLFFTFFFPNCSARQAEKDAVMYLNSTMDRFRTVQGISRFQFVLIMQICKDAIELTSRQEVRLL